MPLDSPRQTTNAAILACAGLLLVGWSGLLVPSLIRSIEPAFDQTDAGIGVYFFVNAVAYVTGSLIGGFMTERIGRRVVLPIAVTLIALGLAGLATVPTWELFLAATIPLGLGGGGIDGGMNGLVLDLYPEGRGRALNLAHLFFSVGALASPLVVGRLAEAGVAWQAIIFGTAVGALPIAILMAVVPLPSGRHARTAGTGVRVGLAWPIIALAVALACYVGSEIGVSNWLVRFLDSATVGLATSSLALFWGCLALGRLASARWSDRFDHARFAAVAALASAVALVGATCRAIAAGLDRAVRCRRLRVRPDLPADHGRRRRPVPGPLGRCGRVPVRLRGGRSDHLPAGHGLRVGRCRARRGDARRGGASAGVRDLPAPRRARPGGSRRRRPAGRGPRLTIRAPRPLRYAAGACRSSRSRASSSAFVAP